MKLVALTEEEINLLELVCKDCADYMEKDPNHIEERDDLVKNARQMGTTIYERIIK